jgi:predicted Zn-dependent protease
MQWHTRRGVAAFGRAATAAAEGDAARRDAEATNARAYLKPVTTWGLMHTRGMGRMQGRMAYWRGDLDEALTWYDRDIAAGGFNPLVHAYRADALLALDRVAEAMRAFEAYLAERSEPREWIMVARALRRAGQDDQAVTLLESAHRRYPAHPALGLERARMLIVARTTRGPHLVKARQVVQATLAAGGEDADLLGLLAWIHAERDDYAAAVQAAQASIRVATEAGQDEIAEAMAGMLEQYREAGLEAGQLQRSPAGD